MSIFKVRKSRIEVSSLQVAGAVSSSVDEGETEIESVAEVEDIQIKSSTSQVDYQKLRGWTHETVLGQNELVWRMESIAAEK